jgi:hypothetical protein
MRGDLSDTSAADACRLLAGSSANGTLLLQGPDGPGSIVFEDGQIVAASSPSRGARLGDRLVGAGYLDEEALERALDEQRSAPGGRRLGAVLVDGGFVPQDAVRLFVQEQVLDALFEILRWRYGAYELRSDVPAVLPEVSLSLTVDEMLVETSRRQREWDELSRVIPDLDAIPSFARDAASATAGLEADEFAVLASIDGQRTIRELAEDLGYGEFEAARIVYALTLLGIVEIELPADEIGAALETAMLGAPWDTDQLLEEPPPTAPEDLGSPAAAPAWPVDEPDAEQEPAEPAAVPAAAGGATGEDGGEAAREDGGEAAREDGGEAAREDGGEDAGEAAGEEAPQPVAAPSAPPSAPPPAPASDEGPSPWEFLPDADAPAAAGRDTGDVGSRWPAPSEEPVTIEAELPPPSYSDVIGELHRIGDREPSSAGSDRDASAGQEPPAQQGPPAADAPPQPAGADAGTGSEHRRRDPLPTPSGDVHEFLRELSRLALDDDAAPEAPATRPPPRRDTPPSSGDDPDDAKRKRRGIFGWGG